MCGGDDWPAQMEQALLHVGSSSCYERARGELNQGPRGSDLGRLGLQGQFQNHYFELPRP